MTLGKMPYAGWTSLCEDLRDPLEHRQQLAPVAAGAPVDGRQHVLVPVVEQRDHGAARVERRTDRRRVDRAGVVHLEEGLGEDLPVAVERHALVVDHPQRRGGHLRQQPGDRVEPVHQRHGAAGSRLTKCQPPHRSQRTGGRPRCRCRGRRSRARRARARAVRPGRSSTSGTGRRAGAPSRTRRARPARRGGGRRCGTPARCRRSRAPAGPVRHRRGTAGSCPAAGAGCRGRRRATSARTGTAPPAPGTTGRCSGRAGGRAARGTRPAVRRGSVSYADRSRKRARNAVVHRRIRSPSRRRRRRAACR